MPTDEEYKSVLGGKFTRQINRLETQQDKMNKSIEDIQQELNETKKNTVNTVSQIKSISEQQGKPLGSKEIVETFRSVIDNLSIRVNKLTANITKDFLPIDQELLNVEKLLTSDKEKDNDKGNELIEKLQDRMGLDIKAYSQEIKDAINRLGKLNDFRKADNAEKSRLHDKKIEELTIEKQNLEERGIFTRLDEKNEQLHIRSYKEEIEERKAIYEKERKIKEDTKQQNKLISKIKANPEGDNGTLSRNQQERILALEKDLKKDIDNVKQRREDMGMNKPKVSGPFADTIGASIAQFKLMGKELAQFGRGVGDWSKGLKGGLPSLSGFGKGLLQGAANFGKLALATIGLIVEFFILALPVIAVVAGIILLVSVLGKVADFLSNIWPFGKKKNKNEVKSPDQNKSKDIQNQTQDDAKSTDTNTDNKTTSPSLEKGIESQTSDQESKILPAGNTTSNEKLMMAPQTTSSRSQGVNRAPVLNKMSTDVAAQQSGGTKNIVIAPQQNTVAQSSNTTTQLPLTANNPDISFRNLNNIEF